MLVLPFLIIIVLLLLATVDCKKKKKNVSRGSITPEDSSTVDEDADVEAVDPTDIKKKLDELNERSKQSSVNAPPVDIERLKKEEKELEDSLQSIIHVYGNDSLEKAKVLHKLGGNKYKQEKYSETVTIALEIVRLHEVNDGVDSVSTAEALSNLGAVYWRLGNQPQECARVMLRVLYLYIKIYGEESKQVLLHRGKLLTYRVANGETSKGLSYKNYKNYKYQNDEI